MEIKLVFLSLICLAPLAGPQAAPKECPEPNLVEASYSGGIDKWFTNGSTVTVECNQNYEMAYARITCVNGKWTKPDPPCKLVRCPSLGHPDPYMLLQMRCQYYDCQTFINCAVGYRYTKQSPVTCQRDNTWTDSIGTCEGILCPDLPQPKNGKILQLERTFGKTATTVCDTGFIISDKQAAIRTCQSNDTWSGKEVTCNPAQCPTLQNPPNGRILQTGRHYKSTATIVCNQGYAATDPKAATRYCQDDNTWSGTVVNCTRKRCPFLVNVENGNLSALTGMYKDNVTLHCNAGYVLDGVHTISCLESGDWDAQLGKCIHPESGINKNLILIVSLVSAGIIIFIVVVLAIVCARSRRSLKRSEIDTCSPGNSHEMQELLERLPESQQRTSSSTSTPQNQQIIDSTNGKTDSHFTFIMAEDLDTAYSDEAEYENFISIIKESIKEAVQALIDVDIIYLCKKTKRGFLSLIHGKDVTETELLNSISNSKIHLKKGQEMIDFNIVPTSIRPTDKVHIGLSAQILRDKHVKDKDTDNEIDLESQYVKLKLLSRDTIDTVQREEIERPDHYQHSISEENGTEIQDEDIIKSNDFEKYVLVRGRAGIGKSTLMQRLLWKWATGEWATQLKAMFLLNLRYLMTVTQKMDFMFMLNMCSVYRTGKTDLMVSNDWLKDNEMEIAFVLDGVDEVDFTGFHKVSENVPIMRTPLQWCFALMRRDMLQKCTLIVSSRPFAELGTIARCIKEKTLSKGPQLVQLVGLTRERVHEFISKNVGKNSQDFVWQTLLKNPILMSVSSITFYCAALCKILGEWKEKPVELMTYTQITAFVMKSFIRRSMQKTDSPLKEEKVLQFLSKLAFGGLARDIGRGSLRLVFGSDDIQSLSNEKELTSLMLKSGLLMQTEIPDSNDKDKCTVLNQFVHLLIQEFLAMAGLLDCTLKEFQNVLHKLGETQQFSMATVFLYGLAFNSGNDTIKQIFVPHCTDKEWREKQEMLIEHAMTLPELEAMQVAHESQLADVACAVGQKHFAEGCHFENTKLTVIDILAVLFVMKHNPQIHDLRLERTDLDKVSIDELASFLEGVNTVEKIVFLDDNLDDACMDKIMLAVKSGETLKSIEISTNSMTDKGLGIIANAISTNQTLISLCISSNKVSDDGLKVISEALGRNKSLRNLRLVFRAATDDGIHHLAGVLKTNKILRELTLIEPDMTDIGVNSLGQALGKSIESFRLDCSNMTDKGVMHLANSLAHCDSLVKLWLHSHQLTDTGVVYLMNCLSQVNITREVSLLGFYMKDDGANAILDAVAEAPKLSIRIWSPKVDKELLQCLRESGKITIV